MVYGRKWLEIQIVRMGEKYPNVVGARQKVWDQCGTEPKNYCLGGRLRLEALGDCYANFPCTDKLQVLWSSMVTLNNQGVPWGEIPKRLGLVPGELPIEAPAELVEV